MSPELLGRLIDEHAAALEMHARQWCPFPEDVVQEAFVKLMHQAHWPAEVVPWLFRVVRNAALTQSRAERRRQQHESRASEEREAWFITNEHSDLDPAEITQALATLPEETREVLIAHVWGGLTFAQIAELTHSSHGTAHRRYVEGLTLLREKWGVSCPTANKTTS